MGLETATTIDQLNPAWPLGLDKKREGDDHLRTIKTAIQGTFPNLEGAMTATNLMLNTLPEAGFTAFLTELLRHVVPTGAILPWSGSVGSIPTGWALCDGSSGTPDLRGRFIIGAGTIAVGTTHDATTTGAGGAGNTGSTAITVAQMPSHNHGGVPLQVGDVDRGNVGAASAFSIDSVDGTTASTGGGEGHTHTMADHTHPQSLPPYYALAYIMKTSTFTMPEL